MRFLDLWRGKKRTSKAETVTALEDFVGLVTGVEEKEVKARLLKLSDKKIVEIAPRQKSLSIFLKERGAKSVVRIGGIKEREIAPLVPKSETFVLSHWENLPFRDASVDFVLIRSVFLKTGLGRVLRESGRVLKVGGQVLLADLHPFSIMVQQEHLKRPVSEDGEGPGLERYWKWFRESGLELDSVKEVFFEGAQRKFLSNERQKKSFDAIRRTPFLILFLLTKGKS